MPKWTTHIGAQAKTDETSWGVFTLRGDYSYKSSADLAAVDRLAPTTKLFKTGTDKNLSARVIWSQIPVGDKLNLTAQVYGDNLTNHRFINFATDFSSLATAVSAARPPRATIACSTSRSSLSACVSASRAFAMRFRSCRLRSASSSSLLSDRIADSRPPPATLEG